ncbi:hypothetical protein D3C72_1893110 [compost metagenome]
MEVLSGITQRSRRYVSLALIGLGSVVLACAGILITVLNATGQYDRSGQILFTSTFGAGIFMTVLAVSAFAWVFIREWPRHHRGVHINAHADIRHAAHERAPSSIENAVSALIMDFVHEREFKRTGREPEYDMTRAERREARRAERERERERDARMEREPSSSPDSSQFPH